jgi:hypothetical protein
LFIDGHADFYQADAEPNGEAASMDLGLSTLQQCRGGPRANRPMPGGRSEQHQVRPQLHQVADDHVEADVIAGSLGERLLVDPSTIIPIVEVMATGWTARPNTHGQLDESLRPDHPAVIHIVRDRQRRPLGPRVAPLAHVSRLR